MRFPFGLSILVPILVLAAIGLPQAQPAADCNENGIADDEETRRVFLPQPTPLPVGGEYYGAALADLDRDGDLDFAIGDADAHALVILRNDGQGSFGREAQPLEFRPLWAQAADADDDGDRDLIFLDGSNGQIRILTNDGHGVFAPGPAVAAPGIVRILAADLTGDGAADVVGIGDTSLLRIYRNDGGGALTAGDELPGLAYVRPVEAADMDGDSDVDLVVGDVYLPAVLVYANDGAGHFALVSSVPTGPPNGIALGDLTGDGRPDVVLAMVMTDDDALLRNDGAGHLAFDRNLPGRANGWPALADLDADGALDLVHAGGSFTPLLVLRNTGDRTFAPPTYPTVSTGYGAPAAADLDGDGFVDLIVGTGQGPLTWLRGRGDATFMAPLSLLTGPLFTSNATRDVVNVDLDGDDLPEVVAATGTLSIFHNRGGGAFAPVQTLPTTAGVSVLAAGDLDGDGDADLIGGSDAGGPVVVFRNNGGTLTEAQRIDAAPRVRQLLLADLDGDGDLDVLVHDDVMVLMNRGDGSFDEPISYAAGTAPARIAVADLDGDGDPDVVGAPITHEGGFVVYTNDGTGALQPREEAFASGGQTVRVPLAFDVNGNGLADLVFIGEDGTVWTFINEGDGRFRAPTSIRRFTNGFGPAVAYDADSDGDTDILLSADGGIQLLLNPGNGRFAFGPNTPLPASIVALAPGELDGTPPFDVSFAVFRDLPGRALVLFGTAAETPDDCDGDRRPDGCDLGDRDCDGNGRLDACDPDGDGDAVPDACDQCAGSDDAADRDGDGTADCLDGCPADPDKQVPGACGCGVPDADPDADGVAACIDNCRNVANPDQANRDGDAAGDACDECPDHPGQIIRGPCQCGEPLTDRDRDRVPDCIDGCPLDAAKAEPGVCGCGVRDEQTGDADGDGQPDCVDNCPRHANADQRDGDGDGIGDPCDALPQLAACAGDCDGDAAVDDRDVRGGIAALFDAAEVASCAPFDTDGDGTVRANDLVEVVRRSRQCRIAASTPTTAPATPTATPTESGADVLVAKGAPPPSLCRAASGEVRIAFALGTDIAVRRYDPTGTASPPTTVSTGNSGGKAPRIACASDGVSLVVWESDVAGVTNGADVMARFLDASGSPVAAPFRLNVDDAGDQRRPTVGTDSNGHWAVVWTGPQGVYLQRFSGMPSAPTQREERVNVEIGGDFPTVGVAGDGSLVVIYGAQVGIAARLYDEQGRPRGLPVALTSNASVDSRPGLAVADDGTFLAFWHGANFVQDELIGRRFSPSGAPLGDQFVVGSILRFIVNIEKTAVAREPDGGVVVTWVLDRSQGGGNEVADIAWRRFAADGVARGEAERANGAAAGFQHSPDVVAGPDGFTIAWYTQPGLGGAEGTYIRRFDAARQPR